MDAAGEDRAAAVLRGTEGEHAAVGARQLQHAAEGTARPTGQHRGAGQPALQLRQRGGIGDAVRLPVQVQSGLRQLARFRRRIGRGALLRDDEPEDAEPDALLIGVLLLDIAPQRAVDLDAAVIDPGLEPVERGVAVPVVVRSPELLVIDQERALAHRAAAEAQLEIVRQRQRGDLLGALQQRFDGIAVARDPVAERVGPEALVEHHRRGGGGLSRAHDGQIGPARPGEEGGHVLRADINAETGCGAEHAAAVGRQKERPHRRAGQLAVRDLQTVVFVDGESVDIQPGAHVLAFKLQQVLPGQLHALFRQRQHVVQRHLPRPLVRLRLPQDRRMIQREGGAVSELDEGEVA